ncbi:MAG: chemotaxis protein CheW, partial [Thermodesulfobacteriota bacterium]
MSNEERKQVPDPGRSMEKEGKYLTFVLDSEDYGISINNVREIIGMMTITTVPRCPDFIKGVINLRGKVIPIVDLRTR